MAEQKYEYLCLDMGGREAVQRAEFLNDYAKEGWELVCAGGVWWTYLRRKCTGIELQEVPEALSKLKRLIAIQCTEGIWNYNPYNFGLAQGLMVALALLEGGESEPLDPPDEWLGDEKGCGTGKQMDENTATKMLKGVIKEHNRLHTLSGRYICWKPTDKAIVLDGTFTLEMLEAIIWWMRNKQKGLAENENGKGVTTD